MVGAGTREFFVNVHVTKCGGTTFRAVLQRCFGGAYAESYAPIHEPPYTRQQIAELVVDRPGLRCLSSHRLSLDLPFDDDRFRLVAIAFVRDPIERLFSGFFYLGDLLRRGSPHRELRWQRWPLDRPEAFAEHVLAHDRYMLDGQFKYLTINSAVDSVAQIEALCESDRLLLLPLERFEESLLVLQRMFPYAFTDLRYERRNSTARYAPVPRTAAELLLPEMRRDTALVQIACRRLDAKIAALWPDAGRFAQDLRALRRSCLRLAVRAGMKKAVLGTLKPRPRPADKGRQEGAV